MGSSKVPGPQGRHEFQLSCSADSPGTLGRQDHASRDRVCVAGDSPGTVGRNDLAASQDMCLLPPAPESTPRAEATEDEAEDRDVYVFAIRALIEAAKTAGAAGIGAGTLVDSFDTLPKLLQEFGGGKVTDELRVAVAAMFRRFGLDELARGLQSGKVTFYVKEYRGARHIVFKGYAGLRRTLTGTRYLLENTKVVNLAIGRAGIVKSAIKSGAWSFVFVAAIEIAEYAVSDRETLADLGVDLLSGFTKTAISAVAGTAAGLALAAAGVAVLPIAAGIAVGIAVSIGLEWVDARLDLTARVKAAVAAGLERLERDYDNAMFEARRTWWYLNTPDGMLWLMRRLGGY